MKVTPAQDTEIVNRLTRPILLLLSGAGLGYIVLFLIAAALRASYPLQLEWLEGGVLDAVGRCMRHERVYVRPTHLWVPFVYMPLYYYVGALVCRVWGFGLEPLRWLSTGCTVGCFLLQGIMASRLARSRAAGVIAAGFFAALYATTGFWFDLARVDMLFTLLVLLGIYCSWRGWPGWAAGAFALAFCAKQTGLIVGVFVLLHEYRRPGYLVRGLGAFALLSAAINWAFTQVYGPWYGYYTRYLPTHQGLELKGFYWFFARDLLYPAAAAIGLVVWAAMWATRRKECSDAQDWAYNRRFFTAATAGLVAGCLASQVHSGGSVNVTLPLDAWLAILFGASVVSMVRWAGDAASNRKLLLLAGGLALLQFVVSARSPLRYIPSADAKREAGEELRGLAEIPGALYVFDNAVDVAAVGKQSFANSDAVFDVLRADDGEVGRKLRQDMEGSFERGEYAGLVSSGPLNPERPPTGAPKGYGEIYALNARRLDPGARARGAFATDPTHVFHACSLHAPCPFAVGNLLLLALYGKRGEQAAQNYIDRAACHIRS